jgi:hypothetical protein
MPFEKQIMGTGMDAYEVEVLRLPQTNDEIAADGPALFSFVETQIALNKFDAPWAAQVWECRLELVEARLPCQFGYYRPRKDEYCPWERWPHSDTVELAKLQLSSGSDLKHDYSGEWLIGLKDNYPGEWPILGADLVSIAFSRFGADSSIFLAAQAVVNADRVKLARRSGLSNMCEVLAFNIGIVLSRKAIKHSSEHTWAIGQRVANGGRKGAEAQHGTREENEVKRQKYREAVAGLVRNGSSNRMAWSQVARRFGVSVSTIRRAQSSQ